MKLSPPCTQAHGLLPASRMHFLRGGPTFPRRPHPQTPATARAPAPPTPPPGRRRVQAQLHRSAARRALCHRPASGHTQPCTPGGREPSQRAGPRTARQPAPPPRTDHAARAATPPARARRALPAHPLLRVRAAAGPCSTAARTAHAAPAAAAPGWTVPLAARRRARHRRSCRLRAVQAARPSQRPQRPRVRAAPAAGRPACAARPRAGTTAQMLRAAPAAATCLMAARGARAAGAPHAAARAPRQREPRSHAAPAADVARALRTGCRMRRALRRRCPRPCPCCPCPCCPRCCPRPRCPCHPCPCCPCWCSTTSRGCSCKQRTRSVSGAAAARTPGRGQPLSQLGRIHGQQSLRGQDTRHHGPCCDPGLH
eukprot:364915-Chlamydomonas_euryale.AAC.3